MVQAGKLNTEIVEYYKLSPGDHMVQSKLIGELVENITDPFPIWSHGKDLMGLPVKVGYVDMPYEGFAYFDNGRFGGVFGEITTLLSEAMNFTMNIEGHSLFGEISQNGTLLEGSLLGRVSTGELDVGADVISNTPERAKWVDFSVSVYKQNVG